MSRSWSTADGDQADQIKLIRHRRQLATDGLPDEKFAVEHGAEHELGARFSTTGFQWMVTSALTGCLMSGDHPTPRENYFFLWAEQGNITVIRCSPTFSATFVCGHAVPISHQGEIEADINPCSVFARDRKLVVGLGSERSLASPEYFHILDGRRDSHGR